MVPRGWIVAVRPRGKRGPYAPAFHGAVYAAKSTAASVAERMRRLNAHLTVRLVREGLVK